MESGADNWEHKTYIPIYEDATWTENGELVRRPSGVYSSSYLVDKMISFIDSELGDGAPFFAYLPSSRSYSVQAPEEYTAPYEETYLTGWHKIRALAMKPPWLGMVPQGAARREMSSTDDWDALSPAEQQYEAKRWQFTQGWSARWMLRLVVSKISLLSAASLPTHCSFLHQIMELKRAARPSKIPPAIAGLYLVRATRSMSPH